ncbi:chloride channel protein [Bacteriovorax sp. PP10]|uniref:Chloride channel protein n=1 Tax=Bacteriovorax antarcticus TaxID=3088717 RepID=A0ABU5VTA6_9BACT|nr:chloride channel protein [Bacteriovorax sp. PP10]MEA9356284.1 chloride channel protein [Bacteriovorax sp. PP10]
MKLTITNYFNESILGVKTSKSAIFNGIIIGSLVGLSVAFYDWLLTDMFAMQTKKYIPLHLLGMLPFIGMILTGLIIKQFSVLTTSTADEVVHAFHTTPKSLSLRKSIPKFFASLTTIGFGASAGLEGSSKWLGAAIGLFTQRIINFLKPVLHFDGNLSDAIMTGASAGIAAIFKAPLSGTIMALESPYKKDFAHEPLVQSFIGAVTSYTVFIQFRGSAKFFIINLNYDLRWQDIFICALIGVITGLFSTSFINILKKINLNFTSKLSLMTKYLLGGILLSLIAYIGLYHFGHYVTMFGGNDVINNLLANKYDIDQSFLISILKSLATIITFAFGGVGGLFLPSATIGACIGEVFQLLFHFATPGILPIIGIASFIAASYNGLLFGPVLIAEISGEPSLVVLGIIASTVSYLVSNGVSNSSHQKDHR